MSSMAKDLVCGMDVDQEQATVRGLTTQHEGQTYYFCCPACKRQFEQNPGQYLSGQRS
jgi:YHS domain-containing protein